MEGHAIVLLDLGAPKIPFSQSLTLLENDVGFGESLDRRVKEAKGKWKDRRRGTLHWSVVGRYYEETQSVVVTLSSSTFKALSEGCSVTSVLCEGGSFILLDIPLDTSFRFDESTGFFLADAIYEVVYNRLQLKKKPHFPFAVSRYGQGLLIVGAIEARDELVLVFSGGSFTPLSMTTIEKIDERKQKSGNVSKLPVVILGIDNSGRIRSSFLKSRHIDGFFCCIVTKLFLYLVSKV